MKKLLLLFLLIGLSCKDTQKSDGAETKTIVVEQNSEGDNGSKNQLDVYDYDGLKPLINKKNNKVHIVNFWATWCAPCIKELPYFERIHSEYKTKNVEVLLVSLDFPRQYDTKLKPFLEQKNIQSKVVCLDDVDQNRWIPDINQNWSGALPATIIYKDDERKFYEKSFTYEELKTELEKFLN